MSLDPKEDRRGKSRHEVGVGGCGVTRGSGEQHLLPPWSGAKCGPTPSSWLLRALARGWRDPDNRDNYRMQTCLKETPWKASSEGGWIEAGTR